MLADALHNTTCCTQEGLDSVCLLRPPHHAHKGTSLTCCRAAVQKRWHQVIVLALAEIYSWSLVKATPQQC